jgi:hypothetical protein
MAVTLVVRGIVPCQGAVYGETAASLRSWPPAAGWACGGRLLLTSLLYRAAHKHDEPGVHPAAYLTGRRG